MTAGVHFDNVSKMYHLGESQRALRHALADLVKSVARRKNQDEKNAFWALREVSFEVKEGEALGIIGPNGAGKTTTLKLLSKITNPTSGKILVNGRVSALIELGAGFHPDLTGRENIYLNAAILGLEKHEVSRKFDGIVAFSGLENFIDTPVKRYSSGMYVRLGFAVAAHIEPQVLLVDEVLSVGDTEFRQKCAQRIEELRRLGTTIVFISHNLYMVESVCDRVLFLANGQIQMEGDATTVISAYEDWMRKSETSATLPDSPFTTHTAFAEITDVAVSPANQDQIADLKPYDPLEIRIHYRVEEPIIQPHIYVKILKLNGETCCLIRPVDHGYTIERIEDEGYISIVIDPIQLVPGNYTVLAELGGSLGGVVLARKHSPTFSVSGSSVGFEGVYVPHVASVSLAHDSISLDV